MDGDEILSEINEAEGKIKKLKDQRNKLIEANKTLLRLVEKMESHIDINEDGFEYSFKDGWNEKEAMRGLKLEPNNYSEEELERQVNQVIETVNSLGNL